MVKTDLLLLSSWCSESSWIAKEHDVFMRPVPKNRSKHDKRISRMGWLKRNQAEVFYHDRWLSTYRQEGQTDMGWAALAFRLRTSCNCQRDQHDALGKRGENSSMRSAVKWCCRCVASVSEKKRTCIFHLAEFSCPPLFECKIKK